MNQSRQMSTIRSVGGVKPPSSSPSYSFSRHRHICGGGKVCLLHLQRKRANINVVVCCHGHSLPSPPALIWSLQGQTRASPIHPDWGMFHSTHPCAASRAISGGPVYISDSIGSHDFALLRSLTLPDGTILCCEHYALPMRDCLFLDPLHNGRAMLKIWNLNKYSGVLGVFNCQGGGWSPEARWNECAAQFSVPVMARVGPAEIEWKRGKTHPFPIEGAAQFVVYFVEARKLQLLLPKEEVELTLDPFNYELLVVAPVTVISPERSISFAPIGLANMLNTGGAVQGSWGEGDPAEVKVKQWWRWRRWSDGGDSRRRRALGVGESQG